MNYPQVFHSPRACCPEQCETGTHTHPLEMPWGWRAAVSSFSWWVLPSGCTEWQQLSQLLLLRAEQSQSRWCSGLIPGAALSNLRNAFWCALPLNCLCHSLNKNSASWISSSSVTWLKGSPSSNSSKHYSAGMQKEVLAAPTAVASQHLPGAQVTPSSSISLLKLHHYSYLILSPFSRQPLQKRSCNHFPKS